MQLLHMAVNCNQGSKLHNHILYASPTAGILHHYRNFLTPFVERNKNTVLSTCKTISFSLFLLTSFGRENFKQSLQPLYIPINCPSFYCFILQGSYRFWKTWKVIASSQASFGVRLSRIHFLTNEPQRTSAGRLGKSWNLVI